MIKNTEYIIDNTDTDSKSEVNRPSEIRSRSGSISSKRAVGVRALSSGIVADIEEESDCLEGSVVEENEEGIVAGVFEMLLGALVKEVAEETLDKVDNKESVSDGETVITQDLSRQIIEEMNEDEDEEPANENGSEVTEMQQVVIDKGLERDQDQIYQEAAKIFVAKVLESSILQITQV